MTKEEQAEIHVRKNPNPNHEYINWDDQTAIFLAGWSARDKEVEILERLQSDYERKIHKLNGALDVATEALEVIAIPSHKSYKNRDTSIHNVYAEKALKEIENVLK